MANSLSRFIIQGCVHHTLDAAPEGKPRALASACRALPIRQTRRESAWMVEAVAGTPAVVLVQCRRPPRVVELDGQPLAEVEHEAANRLARIRFENQSTPRELRLTWSLLPQ